MARELLNYLHDPKKLATETEARSHQSGKAVIRVRKNVHGDSRGELVVSRYVKTKPDEVFLGLLNPQEEDYLKKLPLIIRNLDALVAKGDARSYDLGRVIDPQGESDLISIMVASSSLDKYLVIQAAIYSPESLNQ